MSHIVARQEEKCGKIFYSHPPHLQKSHQGRLEEHSDTMILLPDDFSITMQRHNVLNSARDQGFLIFMEILTFSGVVVTATLLVIVVTDFRFLVNMSTNICQWGK